MRRPNGYGTVTKLSGQRRLPYAIRVAYRDRRGHVRQKYLSYHKTMAEAWKVLDEYNKDRSEGLAPMPDKLTVTLGDIYKRWSDRKYVKAGAASIASYKASWTRLSVLEHTHMREITLDQLQSIIDQDEQEGRSKSTIQNDKLLMKALFSYAMERDIIMKDYSAYVQLPNVEAKHEKGAFTDLQLKRIEQLAEEGFPYADTVLMLCYTGFRITEFLTLTPFAYDRDADTLCGGMKTDAGKNRIVPVHPKIKSYLLNYLQRSGQTIICTEDGKRITSDWYRKICFSAVMQKIGMAQATPHWCRHTFATRLHTAGAPELDIKRLLGHASQDITDHYTHVDTDSLRKAVLLLA